MEFNRLLSQAISFYGEPTGKNLIVKKATALIKLTLKKYETIIDEKNLMNG